MEYAAGSTGKCIYARLDDGDDLHESIVEIVRQEEIRCAWFQIFGGMKSAGVVIGPEKPVIPPTPVWKSINDAREILGTGSVFWEDEQPVIHLHAAMGHHGDTLTGCVRKDSKVYLVTELFVQEIKGIDVSRPWFEQGGINRPTFTSSGEADAAG